MTRKVVLIESPYSGQGLEAIRYLSCCLLDSVLRCEWPSLTRWTITNEGET